MQRSFDPSILERQETAAADIQAFQVTGSSQPCPVNEVGDPEYRSGGVLKSSLHTCEPLPVKLGSAALCISTQYRPAVCALPEWRSSDRMVG